MKLYHVSLDTEERYVFTPKLPNIPQMDEEMITPRICLSDSIEGCLSAVAWGGLDFEDLFDEDYWSAPIMVYEFEEEPTVGPEYLYENDLVRDAELTQEYWVTGRKIVPTNSYLIRVSGYEMEVHDNVSYEDLLEVASGEVDYEDVIDGAFFTLTNVEWEEII